MSTVTKGQTVLYTTKYDTNERQGVVSEVTEVGYLINGTWYNKSEVVIKNILLDNRSSTSSDQLLYG